VFFSILQCASAYPVLAYQGTVEALPYLELEVAGVLLKTLTLLKVLPTLLKPVLLKCLLLKMYTTLLKMLLACRTISAKFQQPPDVLRNGTIVLYLLRTAKPLSVQYCTVLYVR